MKSTRPVNRSSSRAVWTLLLTLASPATHGTWSVVATDPETGEVGSAGASCTPFVAGIVGLVPGHGVLVDQAVSHAKARRLGMRLMAEGASPQDIVQAMSDETFRPDAEVGQYGVATLTSAQGASFTGSEAATWKGHTCSPGVCVQGNTLVGEGVLQATHDAFTRSEGPLVERLVNALAAGADEGGDQRCGARSASSAYVVVARPGESTNSASCAVVSPFLRDETNAVDWLRAEYEMAGCTNVRFLPLIGLELVALFALLPPLASILILLAPRLRRQRSTVTVTLSAILPPVVMLLMLGALSIAGFKIGVWPQVVGIMCMITALVGITCWGAGSGVRRLLSRQERRPRQ